LRSTKDELQQSGSLWLEHEPSVQEVKDEFAKFDLDLYDEIVFCGFGEPTERLEDLLEIAKFVKETYQKPTRLNTNGLSDLMYDKDTTPLFEGLIDSISISLNTPSAEKYLELTRNIFGLKSFEAMLTFASNVTKYVKIVVLTTVDTTLTKDEEAKCQEICDRIGADYRIRAWEE
jgi:TatD family-associated radical SAM protein